MVFSEFAVIGVPSSAGARRTGQEGAPAAIRTAGLLEALAAHGRDVVDLGDLPAVRYRPDPEQPRQQNLDLVVRVARQVADQVERSLSQRRIPLVLGGDCSLSLGVMAGMLRWRPRLGVIYFDADLDLNTPESSPSGIFDGMVVAHALGRGAPQLSGVGPRCPLLSEEDIVFFGYDPESGSIDPPELEALRRSRTPHFPVERVRADATGTAAEALSRLAGRSDGILIHLDVDVTDWPAADVPHPHGLDADSTFAALSVFAAAPRCAGIVVTELNAERDPDGRHAAELVRGLARALGSTAKPRE